MAKKHTLFLLGLWMAALMTATTGLAIHRIYCYCKGESTVSLFGSEGMEHCNHAKKQAVTKKSCCSKPVIPASCCAAEKTGSDGCAVPEGKPCKEDKLDFVQLNEKYLVESPLQFFPDCPQWVRELPILKDYFYPALCEADLKTGYDPFQAKPPPLSGRALCIRHQLFRN